MKLHYEEYPDTLARVPFVLNDNIPRTRSLYSENQNWHENIEIQYCREGDGFVLIDGKQYNFPKGNIALIDSNSIHYTFSNTSMIYSCIIVSTNFCKQIGLDVHRLSFTKVFCDKQLSDLFEEICKEYKEESDLRIARLYYLLLALLMEIIERYSTEKRTEISKKKELTIVKNVLLYIRENFDKKLTLDMISRQVLTDKYTLCKIFKRNTGQSIFENINTFRCMRAAEYITGGKSVSEAANLCGFDNHSFFTKTFKRYMGVLPSKFSKQEI